MTPGQISEVTVIRRPTVYQRLRALAGERKGGLIMEIGDGRWKARRRLSSRVAINSSQIKIPPKNLPKRRAKGRKLAQASD
jgi:hypothetical protein